MIPVVLNGPDGSLLDTTVEVYDFSDAMKREVEGRPTPRLIRTFYLPPIDSLFNEVNLTCRSSLTNRHVWSPPIDFDKQESNQGPEYIHPKPFRPLDEDRLCVVSLETYPPADRGFVPSNSYLIVTYASTLLAPYSSDRVPWEDWGAKRAACLHGVSSRLNWRTNWFSHGFRIALLQRSHIVIRGHAKWSLEILDFTPSHVRRHSRPESWPFDVLAESEADGRSASMHPAHSHVGPELHQGVQVFGPSDPPLPWAFRGWPIPAELPFLRTKLSAPTWRGALVQLDMDAERILLSRVSR